MGAGGAGVWWRDRSRSNAVVRRDGVQLPHFSPTLSPRSQGVNVLSGLGENGQHV